MTLSFIGLGSNLEQPAQQIHTAFTELAKIPNTKLEKTSRLYRSTPLGPQKQPDFINAVAQISTELSPKQLLKCLQQIENSFGRKRHKIWGMPRIIDLDILIYGNETISTTDLTIPHPGLHQRDFVLYPLSEIAPDLILPNGKAIEHAIFHCQTNSSLKKISLETEQN